MQISIYNALKKAKFTEEKLQDALVSSAKYIGTTTGKSEKCNGTTVQKAEAQFKANYDSFQALYRNLLHIRTNIVMSNSGITKDSENVNLFAVEGLPGKHNVASLIVMQKYIHYADDFAEVLQHQYDEAIRKVESDNIRVENRLDDQLRSLTSGDTKKANTGLEEFSRIYHEQNDVKLVDPLELATKLPELRKKYENLVVAIDSKLSEMNALSQIDIDLIG